MRWMIASDIHGSAYYCREMLEAFSREKADRLLLLGDILYHGPRNDLPREYAPKEVFGMLNEYKDRIFCVRGNCDTEVDQMVSDLRGQAGLCNARPPLQPEFPASAAAGRYSAARAHPRPRVGNLRKR